MYSFDYVVIDCQTVFKLCDYFINSIVNAAKRRLFSSIFMNF